MKKLLSLLLVCALLCGCAEKETTPSLTTTTDTTTATPTTTTTTTATTTTAEITSTTPPTETTTPAPVAPTFPEEYTEDELWLHGVIDLIYEEAHDISAQWSDSLFNCVEDENNVAINFEMRLINYGSLGKSTAYNMIPKDYISTTEDYADMVSPYYSAPAVEELMKDFAKGELIEERENGTKMVKVTEWEYLDEDGNIDRFPRFLEIDGVMYTQFATMPFPSGAYEYARIIEKTDTEVTFIFPVTPVSLPDMKYRDTATAKLVLEDGTWKFDGLLNYRLDYNSYSYDWSYLID